MKKIFSLIALTAFMANILWAQDVNTQLKEATSAYSSGELQQTRQALQQALQEIDMAIGAEILKLLPKDMDNMQYEESSDNISSAGFAGLFVTRTYSNADGDQNASIEIITDSPLLAGINAMLALPMFMGDSNQKKIRVGGYRALLTKNEDETSGEVSWDVQVPMGSTLLSFNCQGLGEESKVTGMINALELEKIVTLTR